MGLGVGLPGATSPWLSPRCRSSATANMLLPSTGGYSRLGYAQERLSKLRAAPDPDAVSAWPLLSPRAKAIINNVISAQSRRPTPTRVAIRSLPLVSARTRQHIVVVRVTASIRLLAQLLAGRVDRYAVGVARAMDGLLLPTLDDLIASPVLPARSSRTIRS